MKPTYRIKDWDKHFENHESRKVKRSYWVPIPNRHDGKSYRRIAAHPEGVAVFAAWILILEAASKMPERGVLADEDGPLDSEDLSAMTGFPASIFDSAFNLLTQERFGWLSAEGVRARRKPPATSRNLPESPDTAGTAAVELHGTEGNGTKGNDTELRRSAPDSPPFTSDEFLSTLTDFEAHRKEVKKPLKPTGRKLLYAQMRELGEESSIARMRKAMANGWQGIVFPNENGAKHGTNNELRRTTAAERNNDQLKRNLAVVEKLRRESRGDTSEVQSGDNTTIN